MNEDLLETILKNDIEEAKKVMPTISDFNKKDRFNLGYIHRAVKEI